MPKPSFTGTGLTFVLELFDTWEVKLLKSIFKIHNQSGFLEKNSSESLIKFELGILT